MIPDIEFKIERTVPVPVTRRNSRYPLGKMKVGDSFAVPGEHIQLLRMAISKSHRRTPERGRFTVRKFDGAYRCWRVE